MLSLKNREIGIRDFHFIIIGEYIYETLRKLTNKITENGIIIKSLDI